MVNAEALVALLLGNVLGVKPTSYADLSCQREQNSFQSREAAEDDEIIHERMQHKACGFVSALREHMAIGEDSLHKNNTCL